MNKLKLKGLNNIQIDSIIQENCDYLVSLRTSADGIFQPPKLGEEEVAPTYHLRVLQVEQIVKIGDSTPLKVQQGKSPSQKLRYAIQAYAARIGKDDLETAYEAEMQKITDHYNKKDI